VRPSDRKGEAVRRFPEPTSVKQVQSFLGLSGYFRKFILGYAAIAHPLSNLLRAVLGLILTRRRGMSLCG